MQEGDSIIKAVGWPTKSLPQSPYTCTFVRIYDSNSRSHWGSQAKQRQNSSGVDISPESDSLFHHGASLFLVPMHFQTIKDLSQVYPWPDVTHYNTDSQSRAAFLAVMLTQTRQTCFYFQLIFICLWNNFLNVVHWLILCVNLKGLGDSQIAG